jgi:hypothetical protein
MNNASRSKFYDIKSDLSLFKEKTNGSKTIKFLEGDLNLITDSSPGLLKFEITKALLFFESESKPVLTVEAARIR